MAGITHRAVRTTETAAEKAAEELVNGLGGFVPKLALVYVARDRDQQAIHRALKARLPKETRLVGASTAGEIDHEGMHQGSVLLSALGGDFEVGIGFGRGLSQDAMHAGADAVRQAAQQLGVKPADVDRRSYVGLVFDDGLKFKKDEWLLGARSVAPQLVLVGGGAGDPAMQSVALHADGTVGDDGVVLALFRTDAPWAVAQSHWYLPTGQRVVVTKTDTTRKRALEIDGQPAAKRYSDLLGVPVNELEFGLPRGFSVRPTAQAMGRDHFIMAPWKPLPDGSILFAGMIDAGTELEIMKIGDVSAITRRFLVEEVPKKVSNPQVAMLFHCSGRAWYAKASGQEEALSQAFHGVRYAAGLNVNFEVFRSLHVNTTLTTLLFGAS